MELNPFAIQPSVDMWNGKPLDSLSRDELIAAVKALSRAYESQKNANMVRQAIPWNGPYGPVYTQLGAIAGAKVGDGNPVGMLMASC
jgi:hypothetical protein